MQCQLGRGRSRLFRLPALLGARRALPGLTERSCKIGYLHTSNPADQSTTNYVDRICQQGRKAARARGHYDVTRRASATTFDAKPEIGSGSNRVVRRLFAAGSASFPIQRLLQSEASFFYEHLTA